MILSALEGGSWSELFALLGSFIASAFALVRFSLAQHRALADRFIGFLEESVRRQEEVNDRFQVAIDRLTESVQENSAMLGRMGERL